MIIAVDIVLKNPRFLARVDLTKEFWKNLNKMIKDEREIIINIK